MILAHIFLTYKIDAVMHFAALKSVSDSQKYPDLYFVLNKGGREIFKSEIIDDFDIDTEGQFRMGEGEVVDLGTFLVEG